MNMGPNLKVGHTDNGLTLLQFLSNRLGVSRNKAKAIIDQRRVFINGRRVWMARHRLKSGDQISGSFSTEKSADIKSANILILYEDRDYLVINKPAGISSNGPNSVEQLLNSEAPRGLPRGNSLLADRVFAEPCEAKLPVAAYCVRRLTDCEGQEPQGLAYSAVAKPLATKAGLAKKGQSGNESAADCRVDQARDMAPRMACHAPRVACHRLDKDTSGCLIFAKSAKAKERIITLFARNEIGKKYEAVIRGRLPNSFRPVPSQGEESFRVKETMTIAAPIDGQKAITHIRLLDATPAASPAGSHANGLINAASHVSISIETGRTHQIRKHLASIGHPVMGDQHYGVGREVPQSERLIGRQMLHAVEIKFIQPFSGLPVHAKAPLPADMKDCLQQYHLR